jgi:hypothetical protein
MPYLNIHARLCVLPRITQYFCHMIILETLAKMMIKLSNDAKTMTKPRWTWTFPKCR